MASTGIASNVRGVSGGERKAVRARQAGYGAFAAAVCCAVLRR
jgi:hypothetical protein